LRGRSRRVHQHIAHSLTSALRCVAAVRLAWLQVTHRHDVYGAAGFLGRRSLFHPPRQGRLCRVMHARLLRSRRPPTPPPITPAAALLADRWTQHAPLQASLSPLRQAPLRWEQQQKQQLGLLPFILSAERRWGLSFVLALTLPLPNLCLQCYQRR